MEQREQKKQKVGEPYMENRLQFLLRKNKGKQYLPEYQEQLSKLVIGDNFKILSLEDSDTISAEIIQNGELFQQGNVAWKSQRIPFLEKTELKQILLHIGRRYDDAVYMAIKHSDLCGRVVLNGIDFFNADFQYEDEHSGLIVFYDLSLTNSLVIDFYEEWNEYYYDVEIYGKDWSPNCI